VARGEVGMRAIDTALRGGAEPLAPEPEILMRKSRAGDSRILVVGVDKLLTQVGTCCKPMPPDAITGFVTRGKGISIHRVECVNFRNMAARNPERVIGAEWGEQAVRGDLSGRPAGRCRRPPGLAARHLRRPVAREDQRHGGQGRNRAPATVIGPMMQGFGRGM
jgi:hypothetical protein